MRNCPKCGKKTDADICDSCGLVFKEYEQEKMQKTGQVFQMISAGKLREAKELAEKLSLEHPDGRGDFVLLISNINRDLNITKKYQKANELFSQGDYSQTASLLRNIKAFDPGLEEKVISLRRKAERRNEYAGKFKQAVGLFEKKQYGAAKALFLEVQAQGHQRKDEIKDYLSRLDSVRDELTDEVIAFLSENNFNVAREKFNAVLAVFPDAERDYADIAAVLMQKKKINDTLLAAAHKAREEERFIEAKVIYSFLSWQSEELRPQLLPYVDEIGSKAVISLADCAQADMIDVTGLGIRVKEDGLLNAVSAERQGAQRTDAHLQKINLVHITPDPLADMPCDPVNIDGQEVADFT